MEFKFYPTAAGWRAEEFKGDHRIDVLAPEQKLN